MKRRFSCSTLSTAPWLEHDTGSLCLSSVDGSRRCVQKGRRREGHVLCVFATPILPIFDVASRTLIETLSGCERLGVTVFGDVALSTAGCIAMSRRKWVQHEVEQEFLELDDFCPHAAASFPPPVRVKT